MQQALAGEMPSAETGYGLYSVDKRLKLYYNQPEGLKVSAAYREKARRSTSACRS